MVYNGKPSENGWFGDTTIFGNTQISPIFLVTLTHPPVSLPLVFMVQTNPPKPPKCIHGVFRVKYLSGKIGGEKKDPEPFYRAISRWWIHFLKKNHPGNWGNHHPIWLEHIFQMGWGKTTNQIHTWNPNDPCFAWKGPRFGGFNPQNRGQTGFRYI